MKSALKLKTAVSLITLHDFIFHKTTAFAWYTILSFSGIVIISLEAERLVATSA
jgi:hypothetical protein